MQLTSTRLGSGPADRSLADARLRSTGVGSRGGGHVAGSEPGAGSSWVDGVGLDELGNPTRGSGGWAGPDGDRFGSDDSPWSGGGDTGPEGTDYEGV